MLFLSTIWSVAYIFISVSNSFQIDIGYGVKVSKDAFEKNFSDNKLDVQKVCRNLTSMTWTREERATRSLSGMVNNKFPDAERKAMASPPKVAGVLGK